MDLWKKCLPKKFMLKTQLSQFSHKLNDIILVVKIWLLTEVCLSKYYVTSN